MNEDVKQALLERYRREIQLMNTESNNLAVAETNMLQAESGLRNATHALSSARRRFADRTEQLRRTLEEMKERGIEL